MAIAALPTQSVYHGLFASHLLGRFQTHFFTGFYAFLHLHVLELPLSLGVFTCRSSGTAGSLTPRSEASPSLAAAALSDRMDHHPHPAEMIDQGVITKWNGLKL